MMSAVEIYLCHWLNELLVYIRDRCHWAYSVIDIMTLWFACLIRLQYCSLGGEARNLHLCRRPLKPLELYDLHGCPYCMKVRTALNYLRLDHVIYPCPKESFKHNGICINSRYRPKAKALLGGKKRLTFPLLVDPNKQLSGSEGTPAGVVIMTESDDIVNYLWLEYGDKADASPLYKLMTNFPMFLNRMTIVLRPCLNMGIFRAPSRQPEQQLELVGTYGSPFSLRVQEQLATLELPYHFVYDDPQRGTKSTAASLLPERAAVSVAAGGEQHSFGGLSFLRQPTLKDPNTGVSLKDSNEIVRYLKTTYQTAPVPAERWIDNLVVV